MNLMFVPRMGFVFHCRTFRKYKTDDGHDVEVEVKARCLSCHPQTSKHVIFRPITKALTHEKWGVFFSPRFLPIRLSTYFIVENPDFKYLILLGSGEQKKNRHAFPHGPTIFERNPQPNQQQLKE